ncbi:hypothetical protein [Bacillus sp. FJAT-45350]|uniref:hypothetical protein n=1 Tax=Bacillus sp. FJAT-45350 TaxID=2011014 RepID=UPI000BB74B80|nr:hypothetical protein [Bacillus sp. FJAT-45350]
MSNYLQIFMEYKVKQENIQDYEKAMEEILKELPEFGASNIQWFVATDQDDLYVEMFEVPTDSHYHALKKLRQCNDHHIFSKIAPMVEGGCEKIHCWAFKKKVE